MVHAQSRSYLQWLEILRQPKRLPGQEHAVCALAEVALMVADHLAGSPRDMQISPRDLASALRLETLMEVKMDFASPPGTRSMIENYLRLFPWYAGGTLQDIPESVFEAHGVVQMFVSRHLWDWSIDGTPA